MNLGEFRGNSSDTMLPQPLQAASVDSLTEVQPLNFRTCAEKYLWRCGDRSSTNGSSQRRVTLA
jgi:hypothetical protein